MTDSILSTTKKALGIDADYTVFDPDILMHINSVFATLCQIGIGPVNGFAAADATATWASFLGTATNLGFVKSYMYLKVRLLFDPPVTSFAIASFEKQASEFEWRLSVAIDKPTINSVYAGWWELSPTNEFPPEAQIDDLGINFLTGEVWRKT